MEILSLPNNERTSVFFHGTFFACDIDIGTSTLFMWLIFLIFSVSEGAELSKRIINQIRNCNPTIAF